MRRIFEISLEKLACHDRSASNGSRGVARPPFGRGFSLFVYDHWSVLAQRQRCVDAGRASALAVTLPNKPDAPARPSGRTQPSRKCIFHPVALCLYPLARCTRRGAHVMHHAVISDSEVEVITSGRPLSAHPPAQRGGSTLLCQPSICRLETTHFIAVTRHDGAFPARRTLGESIDLTLALMSLRAAEQNFILREK